MQTNCRRVQHGYSFIFVMWQYVLPVIEISQLSTGQMLKNPIFFLFIKRDTLKSPFFAQIASASTNKHALQCTLLWDQWLYCLLEDIKLQSH